MKLNIGSASIRFDGFTNLDIRKAENVDVVCDCRKLPFGDNSIEEIKAHHILEHFATDETCSVLMEWKRVLKPNGIMEVQVPDGEQIYKSYIASQSNEREIRKGFEWVAQKMYGCVETNRAWHGKDCWKYMHKNVFNWESLRRALEEAGFREVVVERASKETSLDARCIK